MGEVKDISADSLAMPPPYWRGSSAMFHVLRSTSHLADHLQALIPLHARTDEALNEYFSRNLPPPEGDEEFGDICSDLWDIEHEIKLDIDTALLMAAVAAEDDINRFCVYNLHQDVAEPLERLSPTEKLEVLSALMGYPGVKGRHVHSALKQLSSWRNAFAHGHCVDRPTRSLRTNHLVSPEQYPGVPDGVTKCIKMLEGLLELSTYLESISKNPYTSFASVEDAELKDILARVKQFKFTGTPNVYSVSAAT